jgi:hypothetical protein
MKLAPPRPPRRASWIASATPASICAVSASLNRPGSNSPVSPSGAIRCRTARSVAGGGLAFSSAEAVAK